MTLTSLTPAPPPAPRTTLQRVAPRELVASVHDRLLDDLNVQELQKLPTEEAWATVREVASRLVLQAAPDLAGAVRETAIRDIANEVLGLGPLQPLIEDPEISEIMVNSPDEVYVERRGVIYADATRFRDRQHIRRIADRIVAPLGRRVDESSPMVDARLADGSRVNVVLPPVAVDSPVITIRKFQTDRFDMDDLIRVGTLSPEAAGFLRASVVSKVNIVVSGGTGSGKTTLLNAMSAYVPENERIVTIEDPKELQLRQMHVIPLEARPAGVNGTGEVSQRDLVKNALRMRPDRIIIGEVRSSEAFDMMQAMNTGHEGSITTVHANTPRDALSRIENMVLMSGFELPARVIREQMASALHLVVQIERMPDGSRRVVRITEVAGMEGEIIALQDIFAFAYDPDSSVTEVRGGLRPTGVRPAFADRFVRFGISEMQGA